MLHTAVGCTLHTTGVTAALRGNNFVIEYLSEIKPEFENTLVCLSGAQMGSNNEKMEV